MFDLGAWLEELGLGQYADAFENNAIERDMLPELTDDLLEKIGVRAVGHRMKILKAAAGISLSEPEAGAEPVTPPGADRRQITVMFCDLVGSTALSEQLDPEELREVMATYRRAAGEVIARFGGHVAQYLGDGLMVYFGWPQAHEDDAERAVRAGLDIIEAVTDIDVAAPLSVRLGIATGAVVVGESGDGAATNLAVGETPNLAARLQGLAAPDQIVIGEITRRLVGGAFDLEDLGAQTIKGLSAPIRTWQVAGVAVTEGRFDAARGAQLTPLVGREEELALLHRRWEMAVEGDGQLVLLCGEPGIGKSRITEVLYHSLSEQPHTRLRYQCSPFFANTALYPVIQQLEFAACIGRDDSAAARLEKLEGVLRQSGEDIADIVPLFAALLSIDTGDRYPPLDMTPQQQMEATLEVLSDQVIRLAARQPVLMIFEDVHWIDPTTQATLDLLVPKLSEHRVLLVVTYRPEYQPHWTGMGHVSPITLTRLGRAQAADMVAKVTGGAGLPDAVLDQIVDKTDGVPLFVEELTKTVIESGLVVRANGHYELAGPMSDLAIPSTLRDSLMARLDRLAPVKEVAQIGACIGREFAHSLLSAVSPLGENQLNDALDQLVDSELVFRKGAGYMFKHALVQSAAYDSLLIARRHQIHTKIAATLERDRPELIDSEPELFAHHYTEAGLLDRAIPLWLKAGENATLKSAMAEAHGHFSCGLDLIKNAQDEPEWHERELALEIGLGNVYMLTKGWAAPETEEVFLRARTLTDKVNQPDKIFPALNGMFTFYIVQGDQEASVDMARRMLSVALEIKDETLEMVARRCLINGLCWRGHYEEIPENFARVEQLFDIERHGHLVFDYGLDPMVEGCVYRSHSLWITGYPDQSKAVCLAKDEIARKLNHPFQLCQAIGWGGWCYLYSGELDIFRSRLEEMRPIALRYGFGPWIAGSDMFLGYVDWQNGDRKGAISRIETGLELWEGMGCGAVVPIYKAWMAKIYDELGNHDRAMTLVDQALDQIDKWHEEFHWPEILRIKGEIMLQHDPAAAEAVFRESLGASKMHGAKSWELRTAMSLARLWQSQGNINGARDLLKPVYAWFTEGFDTADLKDAKALLEELE